MYRTTMRSTEGWNAAPPTPAPAPRTAWPIDAITYSSYTGHIALQRKAGTEPVTVIARATYGLAYGTRDSNDSTYSSRSGRDAQCASVVNPVFGCTQSTEPSGV